MRISVSSYDFSRALADGRMNDLDLIPKAKELGFDGIEFVRMGQSDAMMRALAPVLRVQSEEYGIPVVAYMVGADFLKNGLEPEVERLKKEAEIAALMGAPRMRHDSSQGRDADGAPVSVEDAIPVLAEGYRRVTEFAAGLGVRTMIENHGYFMQDSDRVERLVRAVDHPNFGWCADMGNFLCADEDPVSAMKTAAPLAVHVHAKDFHYRKPGTGELPAGWFGTRGGAGLRGSIIGHGIVDVPACLELLKKAGYSGWISLEFEGLEDCFTAVKEDLAVMRRLCAQVGL